jgi:hypothetical protein
VTAKIFLATPTHDGNVTSSYSNSVLRLIGSQTSFSVVCGHRVYDNDVVRARSWLVADFLEVEDATHLLFVDSDCDFTPAMVEGMLSTGHDFVCCPYPKKRPGPAIYPGTFLSDKPEVDAEHKCVEIAGFGLGMTLLSRSMLETMVSYYAPTLTFGDYRKGLDKKSTSVGIFNLVIENPGENGVLHSEDYSLSYRWRAIGGRLWLYLGAGVCGHTGTCRYTGSVDDFKNMRMPKEEVAP